VLRIEKAKKKKAHLLAQETKGDFYRWFVADVATIKKRA
jgi:hypothetical protein